MTIVMVFHYSVSFGMVFALNTATIANDDYVLLYRHCKDFTVIYEAVISFANIKSNLNSCHIYYLFSIYEREYYMC